MNNNYDFHLVLIVVMEKKSKFYLYFPIYYPHQIDIDTTSSMKFVQLYFTCQGYQFYTYFFLISNICLINNIKK